MTTSCVQEKVIICIATSEATWPNLLRYCFNHHFKANRERFDLAIVCNGSSSAFSGFIESIRPDYFLGRLNLGFDLAAFDALLKYIPVDRYDRYILLHDDHWFDDVDWFDTLLNLSNKNPNIDIFGNLLDCSEGKLVEHFEIASRILGFGRLLDPIPPVFVQGVAGLFTRKAITAWQQADGIPHIHNNLKNMAEVCERLASYVLYDAGCWFMQIPPGFQRYLRHRDCVSSVLEAPYTIYGKGLHPAGGF
ncbi:MAG: hypothetical protein PHY09_03615 [Desulfuromonadaceae bacterium]|nr:hypothetical protein [Desulfuromonadaceae bacterium]MDD5104162.1 hypothetical protein [Desulfuromonadaceae bacterium]